MAFVDVNDDGKPDLVAISASGTLGKLIIYPNIGTPGNARFGDPVIHLVPGIFAAGRIIVADMDNDGREDIVSSTTSSSGKVGIFKNTGSITSLPFSVIFLSFSYMNDLAIGDINGDGKLEIIVAAEGVTSSGNTGIVVLANHSIPGSLSFSAVNLAMSVAPSAVHLADLNQDFRPELIVAKKNLPEVVIHRNPGLATIDVGSFNMSAGSEVKPAIISWVLALIY
ncbi:MAG TPA: VCBS repeat-containing protein [Parasegetibacter sp.]